MLDPSMIAASDPGPASSRGSNVGLLKQPTESNAIADIHRTDAKYTSGAMEPDIFRAWMTW